MHVRTQNIHFRRILYTLKFVILPNTDSLSEMKRILITCACYHYLFKFIIILFSPAINSQTLAHPLFSSTPNEADLDNTTVIKTTPTTSHTHAALMPPPNHPPIKHSSTEISTSSSGTSGYTIKTKSVTHFEGGKINK